MNNEGFNMSDLSARVHIPEETRKELVEAKLRTQGFTFNDVVTLYQDKSINVDDIPRTVGLSKNDFYRVLEWTGTPKRVTRRHYSRTTGNYTVEDLGVQGKRIPKEIKFKLLKVHLENMGYTIDSVVEAYREKMMLKDIVEKFKISQVNLYVILEHMKVPNRVQRGAKWGAPKPERVDFRPQMEYQPTVVVTPRVGNREVIVLRAAAVMGVMVGVIGWFVN